MGTTECWSKGSKLLKQSKDAIATMALFTKDGTRNEAKGDQSPSRRPEPIEETARRMRLMSASANAIPWPSSLNGAAQSPRNETKLLFIEQNSAVKQTLE